MLDDIRCPVCKRVLLCKIEHDSSCVLEIKCRYCRSVVEVDHSSAPAKFKVIKNS